MACMSSQMGPKNHVDFLAASRMTDFPTDSYSAGPALQNHIYRGCIHSLSTLLCSDVLLSVALFNSSVSQIIMEHLLYARQCISTERCTTMDKV